jgi:hypothetical protein
LLGLCWLFLAGNAGAEPSADDRALATALFHQGRTLLSEGRIAEACPKLEESHRLDPSGGTILNLALCHEQQGLLARSWSEFHEASAFARRDGRGDREEAADSHIRALAPRLSRLTVVVPESVRVEGLRIERNGRDLAHASWSTAMPVDGGEHVLRASAPGKEPFTATLVIGNESDARTIEIPPFVAAAAAPPVPGPTPAPAPTGVTPEADRRTHGLTTRSIVGWSTGAAGLVQWGVAGYFGLRAFRKHAESNSACPAERCSQTGVELNEQAQRAADVSTVLALTGLGAVGAGVYLLLTEPSKPYGANPAQNVPVVALSASATSVSVSGRF